MPEKPEKKEEKEGSCVTINIFCEGKCKRVY